jgi:hypothetical protein
MSARPIGELVAPIIDRAIHVWWLQTLLEDTPQPARKALVMRWWEVGSLTADEAELLIDHNNLEAA